MSNKIRVLVRFRPEIFECFETRSDYEGTKAGTVANRLLKDEIESEQGRGGAYRYSKL